MPSGRRTAWTRRPLRNRLARPRKTLVVLSLRVASGKMSILKRKAMTTTTTAMLGTSRSYVARLRPSDRRRKRSASYSCTVERCRVPLWLSQKKKKKRGRPGMLRVAKTLLERQENHRPHRRVKRCRRPEQLLEEHSTPGRFQASHLCDVLREGIPSTCWDHKKDQRSPGGPWVICYS